MPESLEALWRPIRRPGITAPDSCLVNLYRGDAKMGTAPGFRRGVSRRAGAGRSRSATPPCSGWADVARKDPTLTVKLHSGDINVLAGASRRAYHGVDRILARLVAARARRRPDQPDAAAGGRTESHEHANPRPYSRLNGLKKIIPAPIAATPVIYRVRIIDIRKIGSAKCGGL